MRVALFDATWLYPLKASRRLPHRGLFYFLRRPYYWPLMRARLIPIIFLSAFVLTILFLFAFLPQVAFLAIFHGPAAWLNGLVLTLGEGAAIVGLLFEAFFVDESQVDVFDTVLIDQGLSDLVAQGRLLDQTAETSVKMLGKPTVTAVYAPFSFRQIVEFVILLPVNLIPFVGVPIFLILTGYRAGPFHHWRYFKLLGLNKKERNVYIKRRQMKYTCPCAADVLPYDDGLRGCAMGSEDGEGETVTRRSDNWCRARAISR
ncbi:uncharacterized protein AB675_10279 [Cyphellophora attinorum]|uniref:Uncharacterized protein n=1 Tax=Cyphellophora attinorum TaxID=1664694 RepID=A0A0N1NYP4_9EURO|nr:uncharacterized protein AB675_10279 [Phialophora attinorum]KPI37336.1 hypothetical protein AB675_10279 [Phialophora attinorum]